MADRGRVGLTTDVVVDDMDLDPYRHENALEYSVSHPKKHHVDEEMQDTVVDHKQQQMHDIACNSDTVRILKN